MTEVKVSDQVRDFVRKLAPQPRRKLTLAIKGLAKDLGDTKRLEGELSGWSRLRVSGYRVIFRDGLHRGRRVIECHYVHRRSVVYELFAELTKEELTGN